MIRLYDKYNSPHFDQVLGYRYTEPVLPRDEFIAMGIRWLLSPPVLEVLDADGHPIADMVMPFTQAPKDVYTLLSAEEMTVQITKPAHVVGFRLMEEGVEVMRGRFTRDVTVASGDTLAIPKQEVRLQFGRT